MSLFVFLYSFFHPCNNIKLLLVISCLRFSLHAKIMSVFFCWSCWLDLFRPVATPCGWPRTVFPGSLLSQLISATRILLSSFFRRHQHSDPCIRTGVTNALFSFIFIFVVMLVVFHILFNLPNLTNARLHVGLRLLSFVHYPSSIINSPKYTNSVTLWLATTRGVHSPWGNDAFPPVSDFPSVSENFSDSAENFHTLTSSQKIFDFHPPKFLMTIF